MKIIRIDFQFSGKSFDSAASQLRSGRTERECYFSRTLVHLRGDDTRVYRVRYLHFNGIVPYYKGLRSALPLQDLEHPASQFVAHGDLQEKGY